MTLVQALLVSLIYVISKSPWPFGSLGNYGTLARPMFCGMIVGLVLGDPVKGVQIGAAINLIFLGTISAGGSLPSDMTIAGTFGTAIAITSNLDMDAALAIAVPIGLVGTVGWVLNLSFDCVFVRLAEKYADNAEIDKVWIVNVLLPRAFHFITYWLPCFLGLYLGIDLIGDVLAKLSGKFLAVLNTIGGMLPAVGIGMMLFNMFKGEAKIFFFIGFVLSAFLKLGVLPAAVLFALFAVLYVGTEGFDAVDLGSSEKKTDSIVTKSDRTKAFLNWLYYFQGCYNYERMQGLGFLHAMAPALKRIWGDNKEELSKAMKRHMEFFNTENAFGESVVALCIAMEEQKAQGADIDDATFTSIKTGLMGPFAGIGDTLCQALLIPICTSIFLPYAMEGAVWAPVVASLIYLVIYNAYAYWFAEFGYNRGSEAIVQILESGLINKVIRIANIIGCAVMGVLVCNYVKLGVKIELGGINVQTALFDAICPGILPLLLTLFCSSLYKKGKPVWMVMLIIVAVGAVGGILGII